MTTIGPDSHGKLVAVTGATGHIGANLVRALLEQGRPVRAVVRRPDPAALRGLPVEQVLGDVREPESLERAFAGAEVVYHLAAQISMVGRMGGLVDAVNVAGVHNVVAAVRATGVRRLLHFASIHAFTQRPHDQPLDETRPLATPPAPAYDLSKAEGVRVVQRAVRSGLDAVVVCPTAVVGPHDHKDSRLGRVIRLFASGRLRLTVGGGFDWVDVRDVVQGALTAEERGGAGELYLLGGAWAPFAELAQTLCSVAGQRPPLGSVPAGVAALGTPLFSAWGRWTQREPLFTREALHALREGHPNVCIAKATRELGYQPRPLRDTLRDTLAWQRETGRLP